MALTADIISYYQNLLIMQYGPSPKANATIAALSTGAVMDQLPVKVQEAYTLGTAVAPQLDVIGQYAGVSRSGYSTTGTAITLSDADYTTLIRFASIKNTAGSSLANIQALIYQNFPNQVFVYDTTLMQIGYLIASSVGGQNLVQLLVSEGLLPKPMAVGLSSVVYISSTGFFSMPSYGSPEPPLVSSVQSYSINYVVRGAGGAFYRSLVSSNLGNSLTNGAFWIRIESPFNNYAAYNQAWTWLSYTNTINIATS